VSVTDGRGSAVRAGGLARWLARVAPASARGELAIALVSDARMRVLNRRHRHTDYATDVLSFVPDTEFASAPAPRGPRARRVHLRQGSGARAPHPAPRHLGDLVIATGVARRQARESGHSYQTELRVLTLHGLLHLLGYDHENASDRARMQRVEEQLRRKGGLTAGVIRRAGLSGRRRSSVR
jgi:probable rRNA maturation factor